MTMPLARIPAGQLRRVAVPALVVYALAFIPFLLVGDPDEMLRLQFAGSESKAREIVMGWSHSELIDMAFLQGVDEVHPLAYGLLLAVGSIWAGRVLQGGTARWSSVIAWMALAAAALDLLENVGMIVMIRGHFDSPVPTITTLLAVAKFATLVAVVTYVVGGIARRLRGATG